MPTPVNFFPYKHYFKRPAQLPAGFLEVVQPLADWLMKQLVSAYDEGYSDGRMDAARLETMRRTGKS